MAGQRTISECMWLIAYNFMGSSNYDKQLSWVNGAEESWFYAFEDQYEDVVCQMCGHKGQCLEKHLEEDHYMTVLEYQRQFPNASTRSGPLDEFGQGSKLKVKGILDDHLRTGIKEFMACYEGTYLPTLAQVSTYLKKNYSLRDRERQERDFKDCEDCNKGLRIGAIHEKKHSEIHGDYEDARLFQLACECEAGREREKTGTQYHQWFTDWAEASPKVVKWWLTDSSLPRLPKEAFITEWRQNLSRQKAARGGENFYMKRVLGMDANAKRRDELLISRGEEPLDRREFVEERRPVGWFLR
jgi:hypothetical protein